MPFVLVFRNTPTLFVLPPEDMIKSGFPSPSMSANAIACGFTPVAKSTFAANEMLLPELVLRYTETQPVVPVHVTRISGLPSPSTSAILTAAGAGPVVRSSLVANEILPIVLVLRNIETVVVCSFVTTISGLPSPSISPTATSHGPAPVATSTFAANDPDEILPLELVFLSTETVLLPEPPGAYPPLVTTMSGLPSPSMSTIATPFGNVPV